MLRRSYMWLDGPTDTKELAHMCMCVGEELGVRCSRLRVDSSD